MSKPVRLFFALTWILWLPPLMVVAFYVFVIGKVFELLTPASEKKENPPPEKTEAPIE